MTRFPIRAACVAAALAAGVAATALHAQAPAPVAPAAVPATDAAKPAVPPATDAPKPVAPPLELAALAWLDGCWRGEVGGHEFREHWLPLRGGLMVGAGHMVFEGKTQDFGYLRLETRQDGVYYVSIASDKSELAFRLTTATVDDKDTVFTFSRAGDAFPQRILYRRGVDGWLYATVEGKVKGEVRQVIYPMRRVDCQSGELIRK